MRDMSIPADIDIFDRRLLAEVQADARLTGDELADRVGLSAAACRRRLQALRQRGIIRREVAVIDGAALGAAVTLLVHVVLQDDRRDVLDGFIRRLRQEPLVRQAWYVTGPADFALTVVAPDMAAYEELTRRLFIDDPAVRRFETMVAMRSVKDEPLAYVPPA
jgi:Lrp/AsnC family leucine-responsive transcriptional regulator